MLVIFGGQQFMANRPRYVNAFIYVSFVIRMCRARVREWREWKRRKSIISSHTSGTSTGQTRVTQFSLSSTPKTGLPFKKNARGWWPDRSYDVVRAGKINTCARFNQSKTLPMRTISKNIEKTGSELSKVLAWSDDLASTKVARLWYASANHKSGSSIFNHRPSVITQFHIRGALQWMNLDGIRRVSFFWLAHRVGVVWNTKLENFNATRREIPDVVRENKN